MKLIKASVNIFMPSLFLKIYSYLLYYAEKQVNTFAWDVWNPPVLIFLYVLFGMISIAIMNGIFLVNRYETNGWLFLSSVTGFVIICLYTFSGWLISNPLLNQLFQLSHTRLFPVSVSNGVFLMGYIGLIYNYLRNRNRE